MRSFAARRRPASPEKNPIFPMCDLQHKNLKLQAFLHKCCKVNLNLPAS